jgi:hypothetical protein
MRNRDPASAKRLIQFTAHLRGITAVEVENECKAGCIGGYPIAGIKATENRPNRFKGNKSKIRPKCSIQFIGSLNGEPDNSLKPSMIGRQTRKSGISPPVRSEIIYSTSGARQELEALERQRTD